MERQQKHFIIIIIIIADMPQLSLKIYTIAIHTNIIST